MADATGWTFRPVTNETWPDMAALFDGRGGPKTCWCMVWRTGPEGNRAPVPAPARRAAMQGLVAQGTAVGLLGYDGDSPVAWVSIAPRAVFDASLSPMPDLPGLWSLTCFFIRSDHRRQSGFMALLAAAETHARQNGASGIECYPVDPDSPSYRFSGFVPAFEKAGYVEVARAGLRRHVMRKML
jgi:GNAT superfamily N-acetyltransferase